MKRFAQAVLSLVVISLVALAVSLLSPRPVEATNPQLVNVANIPLPVQGTISVGNTPSVNVANTPTVNLSSTILSVTNAVDSNNKPVPLVVSQTAPQPFQDECVVGIAQNSCNFNAPPTGMRMVVQEFDYQVPQINVGTSQVTLKTTLNNALQAHNFVANPESSGLYFVLHQPTTLYHDDSSAGPVCFIPVPKTAGQCDCQISGYFVPAQ